jgi:hypothetical protein
MSDIHFVTLAGDKTAREQLQALAIQATAIMLQPWFETEEAPSDPKKVTAMVEAVMAGLLKDAPKI